MTERLQPMDGGCTCGTVRYRLNARPLFVHCCHCTWCQRETGSAFAVNALIEAASVQLLKEEPEQVMLPSASGKGQAVFRCPSCRIALWSNYAEAGPKVNFIRAGTLDQTSRVRPDIHIFTSTKQPWVVLPGDVPAVEEFYEISAYWPAHSIERYKATIAR